MAPIALSQRGVLPYSGLSDSLGVMTKSFEDAALMLNVLLGSGKSDYMWFLDRSFAGLRIWFLDPPVEWAPVVGSVKMIDDYSKQYVIQPRGPSFREYAAGFETFTSGLTETPVRTMAKIAEFNRKHYEKALPKAQNIVEKTAAKMSALANEEYQENWLATKPPS
ncbi:hypothetical protein B0H63DRAFT_445787 [Podospora didyma]|uniref:Uncharacterized protein n=1 Tax=Podospora didyma TaxID=330526 RepID=A0AAE0NXM0_9PEZI|nr:hypothetical protein B0H63DRAFT_445787 [Podospora didyma]